jgi:hypothetical protein
MGNLLKRLARSWLRYGENIVSSTKNVEASLQAAKSMLKQCGYCSLSAKVPSIPLGEYWEHVATRELG